jgi:hypothetical protein
MAEDSSMRQSLPVMWVLGMLSSMCGAGAIFWMTSINNKVDMQAGELSKVQAKLAGVEAVLPRILLQLDRIEAEVRKPGDRINK